MEETKALFAEANKATEKTAAKPTALSSVEPIADTITIDDFAKIDMRVAKSAENAKRYQNLISSYVLN